ncbi:SGNH/GDSL hydrolase family protein [Kribbella sp. CA-293567]|uniref:SGNH/GDSL hydrolase family protein n=1 Tax=Kribbella sp. CA-293567 TaxID=3002436 RepID=UPI0022DD960E|nr:SGNH/GDSL hydrolase family protein [Kribbella sp. CA-293567]WBQ04654.1 SGNH/GDSL hydrolase family protein [Kribbella sp. CA-293567]
MFGRRSLGLAGAAALLTGLLVSAPAVAQAADPLETAPLEYVAIGDSSAAGPLIPWQIDLACLRSSVNYPHIAAKQLGARLTDVSCSGAVVPDFTSKQFGFVPPQFSALKLTTDLVTVAIGGNDTGLVTAALSCINLLPAPAGVSCKSRFTAGGKDQLAARITAAGPSVGAALDRIRQLSPNAKILVTGYGTYIRPNGCYPLVPVWPVDANYLQATVDRLNTMLAQQAAAHGAEYVDLRTPSIGHDACAPSSQRWLEGLVPSSIAAPLHPSQAGMAAFGRIVAARATR